MAKTLPESPEWADKIFQLEKDTPALGGPNGPDNWQAQQLANRTLYLKEAVDGFSTGNAPYQSKEAVQHDINIGVIPPDARVSARSDDDNNWLVEYKNINGIAGACQGSCRLS